MDDGDDRRQGRSILMHELMVVIIHTAGWALSMGD